MTQAPAPQRPEASGSFRHAVTLVRLRGVPVRLDWSWLLTAGLVTWLFHTWMSARLDEPLVALVAATVAMLLFFASLLAHELGHAFTSLDRGLPVLGITLFLLGGVTESTREARSARDEFVIVGIGPFISLTLAAGFGLLHTLVQDHQPYAIITGYLGWANLLLAIFNVVPAYPLDGGRLLRSILWALSGRPHGATRWAARVGQLFALGLAALGVWALLTGQGGALGGIWELLIALFLFKGAADAHSRARLRERLETLTARQVMGTVPPAVGPEERLADAVVRIQDRPTILWPVGDPVRATVTLDDFDRVPRDRWAHTRVAEIAHPAAGSTIDAEATMEEVLERIVGSPHQMLVVTSAGRPVGLLTPSLVTEPTRS